jgi:muramoyltetrapeptide carboxypeptidase
MSAKRIRIGVVAPSTRISASSAERVADLAEAAFPGRAELVFHPQCFLAWRHFAGEDAARAEAFVDCANDETLDAIWFARGGYGACRIAEKVLGQLGPAARRKTYLGYSDAGFLLAGLYKHGFGRVAHGPMMNDITRKDGEVAVKRALAFLIEGGRESLEPHHSMGEKRAAFNLTVLSQLLGTSLEPDMSGHTLLIEEVSEYMYRVDRALFHVTSNPMIRKIAGLRLGRVSDVPENDPPFAADEEEVTRDWCARAGIAYRGRADIGHDVHNKIVVFGA